jgi:Tol biopolymer transport system component
MMDKTMKKALRSKRRTKNMSNLNRLSGMMDIKLIVFLLLMLMYCNSNNPLPSSTEVVFPKQLTSSNHDHSPVISPDRNYIAFLSERNTYSIKSIIRLNELWIMDKDGSNQRALVSIDEPYDSTNVISISWAPNSDNMVVHLREESQPDKSEIWRININGDKIRLSSPEDWVEQTSYSPDGTKIAYIIQVPNTPDGLPLYRLYVTNTDFTEKVLIDTGVIDSYVWKNDSKELLYSLYDRPNESFELWKSSINGNEKNQFSNTPAGHQDVAYSTDDKYIVLAGMDIHFAYITYVTTSDNFQPKKVMDNAGIPKWIPKSNHLLVCSEHDTDGKYWTEYLIIDINGNIIKKIAEKNFTQCDFSKDGESFSYSLNGNIWIDKLLE